MPIDDLFTQIDDRFSTDSTFKELKKIIIDKSIETKEGENKIKSVYDNDGKLELEYNGKNYDHDIKGLVDLFTQYLVTTT
jgi:hypothetical protein